MAEKVLFTWSGGKDSALALYELQKDPCFEISALLTTVTKDCDRLGMHGVRSILIEQQAESMDLPLQKIYIATDCSNDFYERTMKQLLEHYQSEGVAAVAFGDIFLKDVREYREQNLRQLGLKSIFPLWGRSTADLADLFIKLGFNAITTCVDSHFLDKKFLGRDFDADFLDELPPKVDPCGENGEFHTFVFNGPSFRRRLTFKRGEIFFRDNRFHICDLLPHQNPTVRP
ncbi:MAG: diphthine--ammonia ligase [Deltaproteobacteria bacterium]|nr:diphthine--ammonia ligase [Deltaproteobacteria bacterium]